MRTMTTDIAAEIEQSLLYKKELCLFQPLLPLWDMTPLLQDHQTIHYQVQLEVLWFWGEICRMDLNRIKYFTWSWEH